ncbi:hypothetical protein BFP77_00055 [Maribacter sp. 4U21]|uniref:hypothetical protein n=1 Tax=Maribacter sp. 4U21 TaxID=1889779 RepID=UPI000C15CBF3|nr:hypothetical protein [Maribacter sp. 4U21]PIB28369.1 hypothetical protein BFP77_00055 [Maribacter sp. 4U21]
MNVKQRFPLSKHPKIEFVVETYSFTIEDNSDKSNNGEYQFAEIKKITIWEKNINWIILILNFILKVLFAEFAGNGTSRNKIRLAFNYNGIEKIIKLQNYNDDTLKKLRYTLNKHITVQNRVTSK